MFYETEYTRIYNFLGFWNFNEMCKFIKNACKNMQNPYYPPYNYSTHWISCRNATSYITKLTFVVKILLEEVTFIKKYFY